MSVSKERISNLLCCALEGGSNYWYQITKMIKPPGPVWTDCEDGTVFPHIDYPLTEGGAILIKDLEEAEMPTARVDLPALLKGLDVMREKYPRHWATFMEENEDAITGDVFLQCVCFGEAIYG